MRMRSNRKEAMRITGSWRTTPILLHALGAEIGILIALLFRTIGVRYLAVVTQYDRRAVRVAGIGVIQPDKPLHPATLKIENLGFRVVGVGARCLALHRVVAAVR